jgi:hypothetical protein
MPRLDGTGPRGTGPLTGWGAGRCVGSRPQSRVPYGFRLPGIVLGGFCRLVGWLSPFRLLRRGPRGGGGSWWRGNRIRW